MGDKSDWELKMMAYSGDVEVTQLFVWVDDDVQYNVMVSQSFLRLYQTFCP